MLGMSSELYPLDKGLVMDATRVRGIGMVRVMIPG